MTPKPTPPSRDGAIALDRKTTRFLGQRQRPGLTLTRKEGEEIQIGEDIVVRVTEIRGGQVRLTISAPDYLPISRPKDGDRS